MNVLLIDIRFLTDRTSEGLGKVVIVKRTGGTRGLGLFAKVDIEAHRYVCEYWGPPGMRDDGMIHSMQTSDGRVINPTGSSCVAAYINHQCKMASCRFEELGRNGEREVWIKTLRDINRREELTLHYNIKKGHLRKALGCPCECLICSK